LRIGVIPDTQCRQGVSLDYLSHIGQYFAIKQPDILLHLGDHADMPALSSYDKGKACFSGRRYIKDVDAARRGMDALMTPIRKARGYKPRQVFCLGNHEERINRAANDQEELEGLVSVNDLRYADYGWKVYPFLEVVMISGIAFSHYFTSGALGRPITSARALLTKKHSSAIAGHQQILDIATSVRADGKMITGVICGAAYPHKESYLGPQGNLHYRGVLTLNDVRPGGEFELMPVTLRYLRKRFG